MKGPPLPFIPAWLDDLGLTPVQARVLIHLWRRADHKTGKCWPSAKSIAEKCKIDRDTLWPALEELERRKLLRREVRAGTSNMFYLFPPAEGGGIDEGLAESAGLQSEESAGHPSPESAGQPVAESAGHKGIPIKEPQRREPIVRDQPARERHPLVLSDIELSETSTRFAIGGADLASELRDFNDRNSAYPSNPTGYSAFRGCLVGRSRNRPRGATMR